MSTRSATTEAELDQLRLALFTMLASHRRLTSRDRRDAGAIGFAHFRLLGELRREERLTPSQLAAASDLSPATVTEMLDTLVAAGLVVRSRNEADKRIVNVSLTAQGRRSFDAKRAQFMKSWSRELADLSPAEVAAASRVLERISALFSDL